MDAEPANTDARACPGCVAAARRIAELEARIAALEEKIRELSRAGKRQAAPFSKGPPQAHPQPPGRKSGPDYGTKAFRAVPSAIDQVLQAPLPACCPRCGGAVLLEKIDQQYQTEIPRRPIYRRFDIAVGRCTCCRRRVRGRHPLQSSDATGCCQSQLGPDAQAAIVHLDKDAGLSQGKISQFFLALFGIRLSRAGACQSMLRTAGKCLPTYHAIVRRVGVAPWIVPDETGWRIGGWGAWLHTFVTDQAVAYLIAGQRGFAASSRIVPQDYVGTLVHDGWAPYEQFYQAAHQTCLGHLLRRCHEMLEVARDGAVIFPRQVKAILQQALALRDRRDAGLIVPATAARAARRLRADMVKLTQWTKSHAANERLAAHLFNQQRHLFTFLAQEGIDATNWRAEQALRPAVVNRKVWGGNRTEDGAAAQSILMSVLRTASLRGVETLGWISNLLRSGPSAPPLLPVPSG